MKKLLLITLMLFSSACFAYTYRVPFKFSEGNKSQWEQLEYRLLADNHKTIYIDMDGEGGDVDIAFKFINVIKQLQAKGHEVIFIVMREAASCHAYTLVYGDEIQLNDRATLNFHAPFSLDRNNNRVYNNYSQEVSNEINETFNLGVMKGFFPEEAINEMLINHKVVIDEEINDQIEYTVVNQVPATGYPRFMRIK